jgi:predicted transcriptional regulator
MGRSDVNIGRAELRVLGYIQRHGPVTHRQVADHFAAVEGVSRTTVLNVLIRLVRKRHLKRKRGKAGIYVYTSSEERPRLLRRMIGQFVGDVLGGSVSPFVAYLADKVDDLSDEDKAELAELLKQLERKAET